jgi:hypothetical protein
MMKARIEDRAEPFARGAENQRNRQGKPSAVAGF